MAVDIIITTYRNTEKLKVCLSSLLENTKYIDYKIYLWVNDPNEEVKSVIHDSIYVEDIMFTDKIIPIYNDSNDGSFSSNNNEAAQEGNSEYILFLNDDMEPINETWLSSMAAVLDNDVKVGAVGAMLLYPNKLIQHIGVMFDPRTNGLPFHIHYQMTLNQFAMHNRYYQAVTGACLLVRRADFEKLGGFDERYYYGYEDIDMCLRLTNSLGKKIVYCAAAQLIHHEGISGTFKKHPRK